MPGKYRTQIGPGSEESKGHGEFQAIEGGQLPTADAMRTLRRMHAAAVTVVTTTDDSGFRGITVSAFCIVSLAPPTVLVCLTTGGEALAAIGVSGRFAVSILSDTQEFLAERFAGRAPLVNAQFDGVKHRVVGTGNPILEDCLVWYDCEVQASYPCGDHHVVVGAVREAGFGSGSFPLLYFDGAYRELQID